MTKLVYKPDDNQTNKIQCNNSIKFVYDLSSRNGFAIEL